MFLLMLPPNLSIHQEDYLWLFLVFFNMYQKSVLHFTIKKNDSYEAPIKSKESFIFNVGFRQFTARPLFSSDNINCNKHKMERFLHHGRFSVASVYAPICFPPLPLIVLKSRDGEQLSIAAVGSLKSVDPDQIILKKIVLTGYPQRVSKLKAIVRYMFHNPDDPVELWTKHGRRGRIKETVGTHGSMKCIFNSSIQQHDTVCMSLYKRAYPKWPELLYQINLLSVQAYFPVMLGNSRLTYRNLVPPTYKARCSLPVAVVRLLCFVGVRFGPRFEVPQSQSGLRDRFEVLSEGCRFLWFFSLRCYETMREESNKKSKLSWSQSLVRKWFSIKNKANDFHAVYDANQGLQV
ncbi:hypothetical protein GUJ93_ZPchr0010g8143 [Zizania palustris]|uniref:Ribosome biogenesis protein BMS1/TSR1 C-terminal domain-containing protein n=1 Tax=Zizania palustris TaxID=103762 RepID=A0A8J5WEQ0_ZIZPA|nr:hypothetical protein GUJ93_ZPchr0010g8143 [Zizania palustris]